MTSFTVRVELHGATREEYVKLHEKMRAAGFHTTIKGTNGLTYHLPPAEYRLENSYLTSEQARDKASGVAYTVKPAHAIFVTEGGNCAWTGLQQVYAAA